MLLLIMLNDLQNYVEYKEICFQHIYLYPATERGIESSSRQLKDDMRPLTFVINKCVELGVFPLATKLAVICILREACMNELMSEFQYGFKGKDHEYMNS